MPRSRFLPRRPVLMSLRPGRSPGFRIVLLPAPSQPRGQWLSRVSSPITVTGSRRIRTAFPGAPSGARTGAYSVAETSRPSDESQPAGVDAARVAARSDLLVLVGVRHRQPGGRVGLDAV